MARMSRFLGLGSEGTAKRQRLSSWWGSARMDEGCQGMLVDLVARGSLEGTATIVHFAHRSSLTFPRSVLGQLPSLSLYRHSLPGAQRLLCLYSQASTRPSHLLFLSLRPVRGNLIAVLLTTFSVTVLSTYRSQGE